MNNMQKFLGALLLALLVLAASACEKLDVVGSGSVKSFGEVLSQFPHLVSPGDSGWFLAAPDGSARFFWSRNFEETPVHDVLIEFDAAPFIAAGLDPQKLPPELTVSAGRITAGAKLGTKQFAIPDPTSPLASYEQIVKQKRSAIGYHGALDHYGVNLGNGNLFEWAKDMGTNDKDMVFVLDPGPFLNAGVDPNRMAGWVFDKVTVDDENGNPIQVDKILKPFDLN
jgi:hypothetical protein